MFAEDVQEKYLISTLSHTEIKSSGTVPFLSHLFQHAKTPLEFALLRFPNSLRISSSLL